ncbi:MAG: DUF4294 domain-containing protein [Flavobacteriales bacterium]|nr:DUF4294 domain-containing protein [Flavobacteriales bacterium]
MRPRPCHYPARKRQGPYLKLAEAELKAEFEQDIKGMTIIQGRILVKLIDRQTGHTSYDLVKQLRGSFEAWMWQGGGQALRQRPQGEYDPEGDDRLVGIHRASHRERRTGHHARAPRTEKATARLVKRKARLYRKYGVSMPVVSAN